MRSRNPQKLRITIEALHSHYLGILIMTKKKRKIQISIGLGLLGLVSLIFYISKDDDQSGLATQENKSLYTVGQMFARKADYLKLNEKDIELVLRGFRDWALKKKSIVDYEANLVSVQKMVDERLEVAAKEVKEEGSKYLEKFVSSGGKKTASGLAYKIIKAGSGHKPKESDWVEVHYHGTLPDGRTFDSSVDRKEKSKFPLNHVIRGWTEGLQLIGEGGEIELVIPPHLAYGDQGSDSAIPSGATLIFRIQLFQISSSKS